MESIPFVTLLIRGVVKISICIDMSIDELEIEIVLPFVAKCDYVDNVDINQQATNLFSALQKAPQAVPDHQHTGGAFQAQ